jgi:hypothetical protein
MSHHLTEELYNKLKVLCRTFASFSHSRSSDRDLLCPCTHFDILPLLCLVPASGTVF